MMSWHRWQIFPPRQQWADPWGVGPLVLALVTLLIYHPVAGFEFLNWDDDTRVLNKPLVVLGLTWEGVKWAFTLPENVFPMPLTYLSFMADVTVFGLFAGGFHLENLVIHLVNVLLLHHLLTRVTGDGGRSLAVAALFALHPRHVEVVAWVVERKELLSFLAGMGALWCYSAYVQATTPLQASRQRLLATLCHLASMMAKPMWVTLPLLLLLWDHWPLRRPPQPLKNRLLEKWPFVLVSFFFAMVTLYAHSRGEGLISLESLDWQQRWQNLFMGYLSYLAKAFFPWELSPFYPLPLTAGPWWHLAGAGGGVAGLSLAAWGLRRRYPHVASGWGWFVVSLVPVSGLVNSGTLVAVADRWSYLPHVGLFCALVWSLPRRWFPVVPLLLFHGLLAVNYLPVWRDNEQLWGYALKVVDPVWREKPLLHLGLHYVASGRVAEALPLFLEAHAASPHNPHVLLSAGTALLKLGREEEARLFYSRLLALPGVAPSLVLMAGTTAFQSANYALALPLLSRVGEGEGVWGERARILRMATLVALGRQEEGKLVMARHFQPGEFRPRRCREMAGLLNSPPFASPPFQPMAAGWRHWCSPVDNPRENP